MRRNFVLIPVLLIGISILGLSLYSGQGIGSWSGAMGSMMGGGFSTPNTVLTSAQASHDMKSSVTNAIVNQANNSITYTGDSVHIVVFGGAMGDNTTGDNPTTGPAEKFVINGLVNPTIHVAKGSKVTLELVNQDTDMPHGIEVSTAGPPYGTMSMMQGGIYPGSIIEPIPAADTINFPMASTSFTASESGTFHYLCQYPGHAAEGMYGTLIVG